uniref:Secreted protein n=1 Tax=Periophthalmus magnuspinnatus TaxID=409849 RepID=A0A3B4B762_9GOBI
MLFFYSVLKCNVLCVLIGCWTVDHCVVRPDWLRDYPDIKSWYTGRGIRPVGRFGRKVMRRNVFFLRAHRPSASADRDWLSH